MAKVRGGSLDPIEVVDANRNIKAGPAVRAVVVPSGKTKGGPAVRAVPVDSAYIAKHGIYAGATQKVYLSNGRSGSKSGPIVPVYGVGIDYSAFLVDTYGASEVWPFVDIPSGTDVFAYVSSDRDGALISTLTYQDTPSHIIGEMSPMVNGSDEGIWLYTTSLNSIYDRNEGSIIFWAKVASASVWEGGPVTLFNFGTSPSNSAIEITINGDSGPDELWFFCQGTGGPAQSITHSPFNSTDWFMVAATWSNSVDEVRFYLNGAQVGSTLTGLMPMGTTPLNTGTCTVGALNVLPEQVFPGWVDYYAVKFGSPIWSPTDIADIYSTGA